MVDVLGPTILKRAAAIFLKERERRGWAQVDVREQMRERGMGVIGTTEIWKAEKGRRLSLKTFARLAALYDLDLWWMLAPDEVQAAWAHWRDLPEANREAARRAWRAGGEGPAASGAASGAFGPPAPGRSLDDAQAAELAGILREVKRALGKRPAEALSLYLAVRPTEADLDAVALAMKSAKRGRRTR